MSPDGSTKPSPPEERLLRLLRGRGRGAPPPPGASVPAGGSPPEPPVAQRPGPSGSWARAVIVGLAVVLVVEVAVMITELARPMPEWRTPEMPEVRAAPAAAEPAQLPSLAETVTRPLFTATVVGPALATRAGPSRGAQQLATRLTLLGIVPGDPSQAIIEDSETKKTYFVAVGQQVIEGAVLDAVRETHVVLDLQGEKIELPL